MTPGITAAKRAKIEHKVYEYPHDPLSESYGKEAAEKMGVSPDRVYKTLVVSLDGQELVIGIVPVSSMLNLKSIAKAAGAKKAVMAAKSDVQRATGYVLGGVSPLGQKKRLRTFIEASAEKHETMFVSAGRRGVEIELRPSDLRVLTNGVFTPLLQ